MRSKLLRIGRMLLLATRKRSGKKICGAFKHGYGRQQGLRVAISPGTNFVIESTGGHPLSKV